MTREPTYQAARAVAATGEAHFARHIIAARRRGETELAQAPHARTIAAIIDARLSRPHRVSASVRSAGHVGRFGYRAGALGVIAAGPRPGRHLTGRACG